MDYDRTITIRRPPGVVFAVLADVQDYIHHPGSPVPEMEKLPPGTTRVGTRWREIVRLAPGLTMTIWTEVTALEPDRLLELAWRGPGMDGWIAYTLSAAPHGSSLRQRERVRFHGLLRPFAALAATLLRPRLDARLVGLRNLLESASGPRGDPSRRPA